MAKNNTVYYLLAAAAVLLFRKQLGIGNLLGSARKFRYRSKGMKKFYTITATEIMDTDYWPNEIDKTGTSISTYVNNANVGDSWKTDTETITRIK